MLRFKLLDKKTKSRLAKMRFLIPFINERERKILIKMAVMAGYVVTYYITQYVAGIEAAKQMEVLTNLILVLNGG